MQFLTPILTFILPYATKAAEKYIPQLLDNLFIKLMMKRKKEDTKMATVKFNAKDESGNPLQNINISYNVGGLAATPKITDVTGEASTSGLPVGTYSFTASGNGYTAKTVSAVAISDATDNIVNFILTAQNEVISNVEKTMQDAMNTVSTSTTTTSAQDWKTVKEAAEKSITDLTTIITSSGLSDTTIITQAYGLVTEAIHKAVNDVEQYKSNLMISRHTKNAWECFLIDLKLAGITLFQMWASKQVNALVAKLKEKVTTI
jgi:hypothetical protein